MYEHACAHALEGIVSKRADSTYQSKCTLSWAKVKCVRSQEFVVGGYTEPTGSRKHFGALLLGYYDDAGSLMYCGRVGTGCNVESLKFSSLTVSCTCAEGRAVSWLTEGDDHARRTPGAT